jgi:hypothetical protein
MSGLPDPPTEAEIEGIRREIEEQQAAWDPLDLPESQAQLARDIRDAGGPEDMIARVGAGIYHDYVSPVAMPKQVLVADAKGHELEEIARKTKQGAYDP